MLLHGLARTGWAMRPLARALERDGHETHVVGYASRSAPLRHLAGEVSDALLRLGLATGGEDVGFVAHSMGGLVVRALGLVMPGFSCGRSVVVACPMRGSLLASRLGASGAMRLAFGPALSDLTPEAVAALPAMPGPYGAIAGDTWSPLGPGAYFVRAWAPGRASDSTVLVDETRAEDAADHVVVRGVHGLLPASARVHDLVRVFLREGSFRSADRPAP